MEINTNLESIGAANRWDLNALSKLAEVLAVKYSVENLFASRCIRQHRIEVASETSGVVFLHQSEWTDVKLHVFERAARHTPAASAAHEHFASREWKAARGKTSKKPR